MAQRTTIHHSHKIHNPILAILFKPVSAIRMRLFKDAPKIQECFGLEIENARHKNKNQYGNGSGNGEDDIAISKTTVLFGVKSVKRGEYMQVGGAITYMMYHSVLALCNVSQHVALDYLTPRANSSLFLRLLGLVYFLSKLHCAHTHKLTHLCVFAMHPLLVNSDLASTPLVVRLII
ncbi:hypothetical protein VNO77_26737 [Canavalia gladiata]|uniref:Uncharacterized protein n=1 Tax=Canavalia gladiata TaxID=3824 RepID=A0AAN9KVM8_CANGL